MRMFLPEGGILNTEENLRYISDENGLIEAAKDGVILEAVAQSCTPSHDLLINLPGCKAVIPREECALGIREGSIKDIAIISRVGKPVCFTVAEINRDGDEPVAVLSRRSAQEKCLNERLINLPEGSVIDAAVTHLEQFGCFVDIGCGICSMIPIDSISVSRISHPRDRFDVGDKIKAVLKYYDGDKFYLSHKELLGTWEENSAMFSPGETVQGVVRSVEPYGIFIELAPNLAGLAEPREDVCPGDTASVYIKSINPEKMKIKLIIVDISHEAPERQRRYFIDSGVIKYWKYSPDGCKKVIESYF